MLLEFQERMKIVEEGWSFVKKGDSVWATHILNTEVCISTQEWPVARARNGEEIKSLIHLVLVKKDMLRYAATHTTMLYCTKSG